MSWIFFRSNSFNDIKIIFIKIIFIPSELIALFNRNFLLELSIQIGKWDLLFGLFGAMSIFLLSLVEYFVKNNIEIYLLFPPLSPPLFETSILEIEKIYSGILLLKNIKPLFHPQEIIYKNDDFFDTRYHLNYNAAIKHTLYIISKYKDQE
jgi:hypothetical protein